ncbi:MAG: toll/interleukin-1 receptor domain-containing protein [Gammaproteobacteria bacterium]|nr:toll/interleukin-1 receptor domain-containing protein [Gammaproteobacteria bacterium]
MRLATQSRFLRDYLQNCLSEMQNIVQTASDELLSETNCAAYIKILIEKYSIQTLLLHLDRKTISTYQKTLSGSELRVDIRTLYGSRQTKQTVLRCHLPISGDAELLELDPMTSNRLSLPKLILINGEICFDVFFNSNQPEESTSAIQRNITWIEQQMANINNELSTYNAQLKNQVDQAIQLKRININCVSDALASIDIPLRKEPIQTMLPNNLSPIKSLACSKYYSVGISYGGLDKNIAEEINIFLKNHAVRTWFFADDAIPGKKLHRTMTELANENERVILLCSKSSLDRPGVLNEIENVLVREAKDGGSSVIIPIALDDHVFEKWEPENSDIATQIKSRIIVTIDQDINTEKSQKALNKLLRALIKNP